MTAFDVIGIGNAIIDVIASADDADLSEMRVEKGIMQLVERERSEFLLAQQAKRGEARLVPGGSVANTLAGIGRLGLNTAFIGRVADDELGRSYAAQTEEEGTRFVNAPVTGGALPTSRSIIFVTPDGERSMNTYLGISGNLGPDDVDEAVFAGSKWLFLEGYLFDKPAGKSAFTAAAEACHKAGGQAGIALSDPFCVDRHRDDFRRLVSESMDYVIGNAHEWESLYQTNLDEALRLATADCHTVICTRSGDPALLFRGNSRVEVPVHRITPVDATGAGDQFAAGLIYGLATGQDLETAGRMGVMAASEVISHVGARPERDLRVDFEKAGLI
ncbi:Sugar or nucleoside kinase, ribokinase family [Paracoccus isoporae]|uniref:Sugar or nucleoside kinase, ribokinase family n=1 Tax=Paracoccus isoporae TaxID=591205 RepID=A0A1G7A3X6_9RHOB|nr:adenosine kinase [Paracoccus isoporae]SDE09539.1 Sugar or nucleoside kinase, ribokinase family [Paracoccus isoporae]